LTALQNGSVDLINEVNPAVAALLATDQKFQLFNISGTAFWYFATRCDTPPFGKFSFH
jgi:hypothetical protein